MANSDKNILITPNRGLSGQPEIQFTGLGNTTITLVVDDTSYANIKFKDNQTEILTINKDPNSQIQLSIGSSESSNERPIFRVDSDGSSSIYAKESVNFTNGGVTLPSAETTALSKNVPGAIVYDSTLKVPKYNDGVKWYTMAKPEKITEGMVLCLDAADPLSSNVGLTTNWTDLSGLCNHGTLVNGPTWTGQFGGIFTFDGIDDYVQLGDFFTYSQFTISLFVAPGKNSGTAYVDIFDNNHTGTRNFVCQQNVTDNNLMGFGAINATNSSGVTLFQLVEEQWDHLVFTWNNSVAKHYRNGVFVSAGAAANPINYSAQTLRIAGWQSGGRHWRGKMGNFISYNRVLSDEEIYYMFTLDRERFGI